MVFSGAVNLARLNINPRPTIKAKQRLDALIPIAPSCYLFISRPLIPVVSDLLLHG
jgi:hypothetical protein